MYNGADQARIHHSLRGTIVVGWLKSITTGHWLYPSFNILASLWERSGSVVECLTRDRRVVGLGLSGVTALCP